MNGTFNVKTIISFDNAHFLSSVELFSYQWLIALFTRVLLTVTVYYYRCPEKCHRGKRKKPSKKLAPRKLPAGNISPRKIVLWKITPRKMPPRKIAPRTIASPPKKNCFIRFFTLSYHLTLTLSTLLILSYRCSF